MDNNFWISAAIAAVVGGAWLFKKGKSAYSFIRKIRRSFKGVCLNPKSRLTDENARRLPSVLCMLLSKEHIRTR